jgi:phenylalanyl-tRNA synthetase alpha chain
VATDDLHDILGRGLEAVRDARTPAALDQVRARYLGRGDGELTVLRRRIGGIADPEAKRQLGLSVNEACRRLEEEVGSRHAALEREQREAALATEALDLTWPAPALRRGHLHPVTMMSREIRRVFTQLGYLTVSGPEVEYDRYNFTLVNMPPGHPSRDTQDTFYVDETRVLRTRRRRCRSGPWWSWEPRCG